MERDDIHELTAAYALNALDEREQAEFEAHLTSCAACRDQLASLRDTAASLAVASAGPAPSPELRGRILERASAERSNVVPLRRNRPFQGALVATAAALALAVGFGAWAFNLRSDLDAQRSANADAQEAAAIVFQPGAQHHPMAGGDGTLVVTPKGQGLLVLPGLPAAPSGKAYEAWVIEDGKPLPAGVFQGGSDRTLALLGRPVPAGATVAVTVEDEDGVDAPTSEPVMSVRV